MDDDCPNAAADDHDAYITLNDLLHRLEGIIADVQDAADGMSHFVVETRLREALQAELPAITFTAADIRAWAGEFSS